MFLFPTVAGLLVLAPVASMVPIASAEQPEAEQPEAEQPEAEQPEAEQPEAEQPEEDSATADEPPAPGDESAGTDEPGPGEPEEPAPAGDEQPEVPIPPPAPQPATPPGAAPPSAPDGDEPLQTEEELAGQDVETSETIVVTGSIIERKEVTTPAPVAVLDRSDLEAAGVVSIGDVLQNLPSQSNAINVQFNNGGDGSTRVNLRGLGASRTLVLINGRRVVPGGLGANSSVDLNAIPLAIIERVEVLKDGASAIYGSDAVAGVVNIITRNDFQGAEASLYTGSSQRGDALMYDVSFVTGSSWDKGNVVFSAGYSDQGDVFAGDRDYSTFDQAYDYETGEISNVGSTGTPEGTILLPPEDDPNHPSNPDHSGTDAWDQLAEDCPSGVCFRDPETEEWRDFNTAGTSDVGEGDFYNYQPINYLVTPLSRYNMFSAGEYEFHERANGFFEASYANRKSDQQLAPEPLFTFLEGVPYSSENIYNPFGVDLTDVRRRLVEAGPRTFAQNIDTFRFVAGLDGRLPEDLPGLGDWRWEMSYNYGRTQGQEIKSGNLVRSRLREAIGPSFIDPDTDVARCGTEANPGSAECVPLDLLGGPGSITEEQLDYLTYTGIANGFNEQQSLLGTARGRIARTPWGGDISLALGATYREEAGAFTPDPLTASGDTTGNKQEPTAGEYDVAEGFTELSIVPVVGHDLAEWLELNGAVRGFNYDTFGSGVTWKTGALWRHDVGVGVRGTYSTAFRAPSIAELFSGQADSFPGVSDPCDTSQGPRASEAIEENCAAEGIPDDFTDPATQLPTRVGGNPDLEAEDAKVFTAGIVYEPTFASGLSVAVDYFNFDIDNAIDSLGASVILNRCYARGDQAACDLITRDPGSNRIVEIDDRQTNIEGGNETSGIDFDVAYEHGVRSVGNFRHQLEGTWLHQYDFILDPADEQSRVEGVGVYDLGVFPAWKFNASTMWGLDAFGAGANLRFFNGYDECDDNDCSDDDGDGEPDNPSRSVSAYATADLFGSYTVETPAGTSVLTIGVNNILDQDPPFIDNGFLANSDASTYDFLGRFFYLRFNQRF